MNFTSLIYLPGLAFTVFLYNRASVHFRPLILLAASWMFFVYGSPGSFLILLAVTAVTYLSGLIISWSGCSDVMKNLCLIITIILCISCLSLFKYTGLFFLPAGISFYTFQALSYCIDVYRGDYTAEKKFLRYALFTSFFPQVVAGPIERPADLIPQLDGHLSADKNLLMSGGFLMLRGFMKKIIIADGIAPVCDSIFSAAANDLTGPMTAAGAVLFACQIYADFSGYTDIARGSAELFGIKLTENFKDPYQADSIRDFWRRWHITLTKWLTDYVYIPLGGNRAGNFRKAFNILAVFALSGVWHGFGIHFLLWGILHGLLIIFEDRWKIRPGKAVTFVLVCLLWIMFRASTMEQALSMYAALPFGWLSLPGLLSTWIGAHLPETIRILTAVPLLYMTRREPAVDEQYPALSQLIIGYMLFLAIMICVFINVNSGSSNAFIYFQF